MEFPLAAERMPMWRRALTLQEPHASQTRRYIRVLSWSLLVVGLGFVVLWPILQLGLRAFADQAAAFGRMRLIPGFTTTLITTTVLAVASTAVAVLVGTALAWCASVLPDRFQKIGQLLPLIPLMFPTAAVTTGWIFLLSPEIGYLNVFLRELLFFLHLDEGPFNIYGIHWIGIITGLLLASFIYLFVQAGLQNLGQELEAAAAACGAPPLRRFFTITIPLLRPSILFGASIAFLLGLGQFTVPLLLGRVTQINVLTTEMYNLTLSIPVDYGAGSALGFPIFAVGLILVGVQKRLLVDPKRFVVVSARSRLQARKTHWWAAAVIIIYTLLTTLLPLLALIYVSLSPFWTSEITFDHLTLQHYRAVFQNSLFVNSIWTSILASAVAVVILIPLGFACAFALRHEASIPRSLRWLIDVLVTVPVAVPASLMGFGILFAYTQPPFELYGTSAIIVVTYVTLMIGHSTRLQLATLMATGNEFLEASKACGASPTRSLIKILLPMTRTGIVAAAALTFVLLSHEFSASMMVRSIGTQVMGSVFYDALSSGVYAEAAVLAILMVVVTLGGVLIAVAIGGIDSLKKM